MYSMLNHKKTSTYTKHVHLYPLIHSYTPTHTYTHPYIPNHTHLYSRSNCGCGFDSLSGANSLYLVLRAVFRLFIDLVHVMSVSASATSSSSEGGDGDGVTEADVIPLVVIACGRYLALATYHFRHMFII